MELDQFFHLKEKKPVFARCNIQMNCQANTKEEAIIMAGKLLVSLGYVEERYIEGMLEREKVLSTYIGNYVAIPHGEYGYKNDIINSGIVVLHFPNGVTFNTEKAYFVIGIAGKGDEHMKILSTIALALDDEHFVLGLCKKNDIDAIYNAFSNE